MAVVGGSFGFEVMVGVRWWDLIVGLVVGDDGLGFIFGNFYFCELLLAQNDLEWPISPYSQLFQSFPTKVAQNDSEWPFHPICNFSNLFPLKWLRMTRNGKFHPICNFSNLFPPK